MSIGTLNDLERDAAKCFAIFHDIKCVFAGGGKFQSLHIEDQVTGNEIAVHGDGFDVDIELDRASRQQFLSVFIDEAHLEFVRAGIFCVEEEAQGQGAMGMFYRKMRCPNGIKGTEDTEFPIKVGGGFAKDCSQ